MRLFHPQALRIAALGIVTLVSACSGGGSGSSPVVSPVMPATPSPSPTASPPASSSAPLTVGSQPASATLPPIAGGLSATIAFPATSSGSATITATLSATLPSGTPAIQAMKRRPATIGAAGISPLGYIGVVASSTVTFGTTPALSFPIGGPITPSIRTAYVAVYDPTQPAAGWTTVGGQGQVTGGGLTFLPAASPITFVAGQLYVYGLFTVPTALPATSNIVRFATGYGNIDVQLRPDVAPNTVANFVKYIVRGAYAPRVGSSQTNVGVIHRSVPGFVIQGGGFTIQNGSFTAIPADPPIPNEFKLSNLRGTIAMAKLANDPNSATTQWFFNLSDSNAANLDNQDGGYTVFGKITNAEGLATMDTIAGLPILNPPQYAPPLDQLPVSTNYAGGPVQLSDLVLVNTVDFICDGHPCT